MQAAGVPPKAHFNHTQSTWGYARQRVRIVVPAGLALSTERLPNVFLGSA